MALSFNDGNPEKKASDKVEGGTGNTQSDNGYFVGNSRCNNCKRICLQSISVFAGVREKGARENKGNCKKQQGGADSRKPVTEEVNCPFRIDDDLKRYMSLYLDYLFVKPMDNDSCLLRLALIAIILFGQKLHDIHKTLRSLNEFLKLKEMR